MRWKFYDLLDSIFVRWNCMILASLWYIQSPPNDVKTAWESYQTHLACKASRTLHAGAIWSKLNISVGYLWEPLCCIVNLEQLNSFYMFDDHESILSCRNTGKQHGLFMCTFYVCLPMHSCDWLAWLNQFSNMFWLFDGVYSKNTLHNTMWPSTCVVPTGQMMIVQSPLLMSSLCMCA